jgi:quercetin dioxygenase-like cupin family protein
MQIKRAGSRPSSKGSSEYFTGSVRIDPLHTATESACVSCAYVTFEPGARSAWHTHPLGQTHSSHSERVEETELSTGVVGLRGGFVMR